jgi:integrase
MSGPIEYTNGDQTVRIYPTTARERPVYQLSYYQGGERKRQSFSNLVKAKREAKSVLGQLANETRVGGVMTSEEIQSAVVAEKKLEGLDIPLHVATQEYVSAIKLLPDGVSLREACEFYRKHQAPDVLSLTVGQMQARFVESRSRLGLSPEYVKQCELAVDALIKGCRLSADAKNLPETRQIVDWLDGKYPNAATKNNKMRTLQAFGRWLIEQRLAASDPFAGIKEWKAKPQLVEIYTPDQIKTLLAAVPKRIVPGLAIGAFGGLRTAELHRLEWKEINLERGFITVAAEKAKTAARRLVPIQNNLRAWLASHAQTDGHVCPHDRSHTAAIIRTSGFNSKRNGLRHSYISYRLAQTQDIGKVALEAGNSPQVIFRHYRELVAPDDVARWFGVMPPGE